MSKRFGAVQRSDGKWQLCYLDSAHGPDGNPGPKSLCCVPPKEGRTFRSRWIQHAHDSADEAEECQIAIAQVGGIKSYEKPAVYVAPVVEEPKVDEPAVEDETATEDLEDDVSVEVETGEAVPEDVEDETVSDSASVELEYDYEGYEVPKEPEDAEADEG